MENYTNRYDDDFKPIQYDLNLDGRASDWELLLPGHAVLFYRRKQLGLTQLEVSEKADIKLAQYQKLECGERKMSSASLRIALSICDVLDLDPHRFTGYRRERGRDRG